MIIQKKLPYSILESLPGNCKDLVVFQLREHDKNKCQLKIMDSLAEITLMRCQDCWSTWEKFYDEDGNRDFMEVLYVQNFGEINKISPWNSDYYHQHIKAFRKLIPDDDDLEDPYYNFEYFY